MGKHFFNYDDGNLLIRMGNNMAMDIYSGKLHFLSSCSDDDEN